MVLNGKRVATQVPVDVVERVPSMLQGRWECDAVSTDGYTFAGTTTAFVRFEGAPDQFLLGCHHVLAGTACFNLPTSGPPDYSVTYEGKPVGALAALPFNPEQVDAALATCDDEPQITFRWQDDTIAIDSILQPHAPVPQDLLIVTRDGVVPVRFLTFVDGHRETYYKWQDSRPLTFDGLLHCTAKHPSFAPGDSGAAIVTASGTLVGLHFAGTQIDSYGFPAARVFDSFGSGLTLC
jgi:hypothetical protein